MTSADTSAAQFDPSLAESKGSSLRRWLAPFAVGLALLSAFLTFVVLTGLTRIEPTRQVAVSFMLMNGATILVLVGIIVREVWQLTQARRRGRAAARLHVQIVSLFSIIAVRAWLSFKESLTNFSLFCVIIFSKARERK